MFMCIDEIEYYLCMKHGKYGFVYYILIQIHKTTLKKREMEGRGDSHCENSLKCFNGKYKHVS